MYCITASGSHKRNQPEQGSALLERESGIQVSCWTIDTRCKSHGVPADRYMFQEKDGQCSIAGTGQRQAAYEGLNKLVDAASASCKGWAPRKHSG